MSGCESNTAAYHFDLSDNIAGYPAVTPDYPMVGGKRRTKKRTKRRTKRRNASIKSGGYPKNKKKRSKRSKRSKKSKKRSRKRTNKRGGNAVPIVVGAAALGLGAAAGYMYYKNKKKNIAPEPDNNTNSESDNAPPPVMTPTSNCQELMCSEELYDDRGVKFWSRRNHPDKKKSDDPEETKAIREKFQGVYNCKANEQYCK